VSAITAQDAPAPGRRQIKGPSALGSDPRQFWHLAWTLAVTDFKLRFFGSVLGYLWTLMRPLLLFAVLLLVFTQVLDLTSGVDFYAQALLLGIVLYNFFSEVTGQSVRSILDREHIVRKVEFPRLAVPLAVLIQALFNLGLSLLVAAAFILAAGAEVRWSWFQLIPLVALLAFYAFGLAMLLSMLFVRYRDVEPIWDVFLQAMFYLSPIFYTVDLVAERFNASVVEWLMVNPFAAILQQARHALLGGTHPSAIDAAGGAPRLLLPAAIAVVLFAIGAQVFRRRAPRVAEEL
jgi:ABC-2 type transport system permease protein